MTRIDDIRLRRDTLANWLSVDPTLNDGEVGLITDQRNFRVGDGATAFSSLIDWITGGGAAGLSVALIVDEKSSGTSGGDFAAGSWRTRDLNTIVQNDIGVSLASNQITIPAGDYIAVAGCPAYLTDFHQCQLANITDSQYYQGQSTYSRYNSYAVTLSFLFQKLSLPSQKVLELRHRCGTTKVNNGFGVANSFGSAEIYSILLVIEL